jgi:5-methylcytosine-specific restriction endonuclease McrA
MRRWSNSVTSKRILAQRRAETRGWPLEAGGRGHVSPARICRHGEIVPAGGSCSRCREEARARYRRRGSASVRGYDRAYVRLRPQVLSEEQVCWLCGLPARPGDPLTVDHVLPLALGGTSHRTNLRAAHASCNSSRGGARFPGVSRAGAET